jgi:hypothetical protein
MSCTPDSRFRNGPNRLRPPIAGLPSPFATPRVRACCEVARRHSVRHRGAFEARHRPVVGSDHRGSFPTAVRHQGANHVACARLDRSANIFPQSDRADLAIPENRPRYGSTGTQARRPRKRRARDRTSPLALFSQLGYRPLGSCPRAAGWSAATLCIAASVALC